MPQEKNPSQTFISKYNKETSQTAVPRKFAELLGLGQDEGDSIQWEMYADHFEVRRVIIRKTTINPDEEAEKK